MGDYFCLSRVLSLSPLKDPQGCLFVSRMAIGQEETSTNQAGRRRGMTREMPTTRSLVVAMSVEKLRSFCQVPAYISMELSDGVAVSTVGGENNVVYFTLEQFVTSLRFPISSSVKQFLHFT